MNDKKNKTEQIQSAYLNKLRVNKSQVAVFLINGIKQVGYIESFDQFVIILATGETTELIYKHAIATVVPSNNTKNIKNK